MLFDPRYKTYASYNRDLWNTASYDTGSRDFTITVPNGFSKRYRKSQLFLIIHKNVLIVFAVYLTDT